MTGSRTISDRIVDDLGRVFRRNLNCILHRAESFELFSTIDSYLILLGKRIASSWSIERYISFAYIWWNQSWRKKRHGLGWLAKIWNKLHTIIEATFRTKNIIFYDWLRSEIGYEVMIHKSSLQWLWEQNELIRYKATSYIFMSLV